MNNIKELLNKPNIRAAIATAISFIVAISGYLLLASFPILFVACFFMFLLIVAIAFLYVVYNLFYNDFTKD